MTAVLDMSQSIIINLFGEIWLYYGNKYFLNRKMRVEH